MYCPQCGREIESANDSCLYCGHAFVPALQQDMMTKKSDSPESVNNVTLETVNRDSDEVLRKEKTKQAQPGLNRLGLVAGILAALAILAILFGVGTTAGWWSFSQGGGLEETSQTPVDTSANTPDEASVEPADEKAIRKILPEVFTPPTKPETTAIADDASEFKLVSRKLEQLTEDEHNENQYFATVRSIWESPNTRATAFVRTMS